MTVKSGAERAEYQAMGGWCEIWQCPRRTGRKEGRRKLVTVRIKKNSI